MKLNGLILAGEDLEPTTGYVSIQDGIIEEVVETGGDRYKHIVMPGLINCHTHIGDHLFQDAGITQPLGSIVGSPDGIKHRLLREAQPDDLIRGMAEAENEIINSGTTTFIDFREQGVDGIRWFRNAIKTVDGLAYGRPTGGEDLSEELSNLLVEADGIGLDRVGLYSDGELASIRRIAGNRPVAVHVAEVRHIQGEMERAVQVLGSDVLIHLTKSPGKDLDIVAEEGRRAVICPRSNLFAGVGVPPIDGLLERGIDVGIGTDNSMLNSLDLFREMEIALLMMKERKPRDVLRMATTVGAKVAGVSETTGSIEEGKSADLLVLNRGAGLRHTRDPHAAIVKRAGPVNVSTVLKGGEKILCRRGE